MNVGEAVAAFLEQCGVELAFGVISIHNMPILDAFHRRKRIRFVPARGEAGAVCMADAGARVSGKLGVAVTSTGTAAGNAAGAMVEALTAGTPLLHLTGQIDSPYLDRDLGYLHEARDQLGMLKAVSKGAFRVSRPDQVIKVLREAVAAANMPPTGPVSVEIPIDVQQAPFTGAVVSPLPPTRISPQGLEDLLGKVQKARRPLLWLGGGARHAAAEARKLADRGWGIVTSVQGRGIVPEDHPMTLGAFNISPPVEAFYGTCDALVVVGSRLRSNETLGYKLKLPKPLYRVDAEPARADHPYAPALFVRADARDALEALSILDVSIERNFSPELKKAKNEATLQARKALGPYEGLVDALQRHAGRDFAWVRDVTVSNSTWGNRLLELYGPRDGVHALGGGIGMGLPMAVGAALASGRKVLCLAGDGGLALNLGEIATAIQERANFTLVLMNDRGYGVIRNIQDAQYGGRRAYVDLVTPDFERLASAYGLAFHRIQSSQQFEAVLKNAVRSPGPALVEVDMNAIGPYAGVFAGPPVRKEEAAAK